MATHTLIGLVDGTKLIVSDNNVGEDEIIRLLTETGRPDGSLVSFVPVQAIEGWFRVNPAHVAFVSSINRA